MSSVTTRRIVVRVHYYLSISLHLCCPCYSSIFCFVYPAFERWASEAALGGGCGDISLLGHPAGQLHAGLLLHGLQHGRQAGEQVLQRRHGIGRVLCTACCPDVDLGVEALHRARHLACSSDIKCTAVRLTFNEHHILSCRPLSITKGAA